VVEQPPATGKGSEPSEDANGKGDEEAHGNGHAYGKSGKGGH
jgi:hypothetical protein